MPSREMTLEEWVTRLPWSHRARQEFEALRAAHQERDADARRLDWRLATLQAALMRIKRRIGRPVEYADNAHRCTWRQQAERAVQIASDALDKDAAAIDAAMAADTQTPTEEEHAD